MSDTYPNRYTIPKPEHGAQAWLNLRWQNEAGEKRITASVAGAVHGEGYNAQATADLAVELLAKTPPTVKRPNKAMLRGTTLEPLILTQTAEYYDMAIVSPDVMYCYEEPGVRMLANVDGRGGDVVFEIKSVGRGFDGVLPPYWRWQGVQLAICCDVPSIEWVVCDLASNLELKFLTQHVSSDDRQIHIDACRRFLGFIDLGMIPEGVSPSYENAASLHPVAEPTVAVLDEGVDGLVRELAVARDMKRCAETAETELKAQIALALGDNEFGSFEGYNIVSWRNRTRTGFDMARFKQEHPALAAKFVAESAYREMKVLTKTKETGNV